jgi:tetratricopeptide (TPR) repeat protein
MVPAYKFFPRHLGRNTWLVCLLAAGSVLCAAAQAAPASAAAGDAAAAAQPVLYDRYIKINLPGGWLERRSWELGEDRSLPLYNPSTEAVVFVWGFDRPLYRHGYIESLATGDRLSRRLEMDLSLWPAEASRYYAMVSSGFMMKATAHTVTMGPSLKPGQVRYLGKIKAGRAELDLVEYISDAQVDNEFATKYRMNPELSGSRAQILFGQAIFGHGTQGYTLAACRFTTQTEDTSWIQPLLENVEAVSKGEREKAAAAEHIRDELSHAAAVTDDHRYATALVELGAVLQQDPQNDNALMLEGQALLRLHRLEEAEKALRQAVAINQNNDRAHFLLGAVLWQANKRDEAKAEWQVVQRISPLYPEIEEVLLQKRMQRPIAAREK